MATTMNVRLLVLFLIAAATVLPRTEAAYHEVGDSDGWHVPISDVNFYSTWATGKNFSVGDILGFNFNTGAHDVATVTKAAYDACNIANPINTVSTGPANITLNTTGENYFICTIAQHCAGGQKLAINVMASGTTPTTPAGVTPPPPPSTTPPPPPSSGTSASSLAATFSLILVTIASTIFYLF